MILIFILNAGRLNDINLSGWFAFLTFVPILNLGIIALYFIDGTKGTNKYGNDLKVRIKENKKPKEGLNLNSKSSENITLSEIDKKIEILKDSLTSKILDKAEYDEKEKKLNDEKQKLLRRNYDRESYLQNIDKLKLLLENDILTQSEYDNKITALDNKYNRNNIPKQQINSKTKLYYIANGKQTGPISAQRLVSMIKIKEINPNCYVMLENESNHSKRAYEIVELLRNI